MKVHCAKLSDKFENSIKQGEMSLKNMAFQTSCKKKVEQYQAYIGDYL